MTKFDSYDGSCVYFVETDDVNIKLFFIDATHIMKELMRESIGGKREIFLKVEEVLQGCYETSLD